MRTPQDIINRKEANQKYYKLEENKEQKRNYMKSYRTRPYVKAKLHEYYIVNKMNWGEIKKARKARNWGGVREKSKIIRALHEEWATKNGYRDNENLHAKNTERFTNDT